MNGCPCFIFHLCSQINVSAANRTLAPSSSFRKDKEPKFVPYEPYKASVTPLVSRPKKTKKKSLNSTSSGSIRAASEEPISPEVVPPHPMSPVPCSSPTYVDPNQSDVVENEILLSRIAQLERDLAESEKQLKIQTQVNSEVKKLLVASVGEDIEAQVDYLTQDKARLSADIHQYTSKISRDFEEKEKLFVESNLWKSKFLASR